MVRQAMTSSLEPMDTAKSILDVIGLLRKHKVEPVHVVSTVDGAKTQISFCVPFDQVRA